MKKSSIRLRVTLWFTFLMSLLVVAVLAFLLMFSHYVARVTTEKKLIHAVEDSGVNLQWHGTRVQVDCEPEENREGAYLIYYNADGRVLYGSLPDGFEQHIPLRDRKIRETTQNGAKWLVFDEKKMLLHNNAVWTRGVLQIREMDEVYTDMQRLALITFPFMVLLAALGGYFLTGRAFRPVQQIAALAEQIGDGKDLSRRIGLAGSKDEIHALANTFDRMFDRLEASFENEKQFTADASHELRTPVAVILSQSADALEHAETLEEARAALETIHQQGQKMSGLISQLLMLTRADKGQQKLTLERVDLSELCEVVVEELRERAEDRGITLQTALEPHLTLQGDETLLMRLLINLLTNGIAYSKMGGTVHLTLRRSGGWIEGRVRDDGIGIATEHLDRIWKRFYQVEPSRTADEGSTGLGLSMVKWIVEAHGGSISVQSTLGVGSEFTFLLPA